MKPFLNLSQAISKFRGNLGCRNFIPKKFYNIDHWEKNIGTNEATPESAEPESVDADAVVGLETTNEGFPAKITF